MGRRSSCPVSQVSPAASSITKAKAGRSRHGPSRPNPGMRTMIRSGRSAWRASRPRPSWSSTRGVWFSTTTSLVATRRCNSSMPRGSPRSRVRLRLLVLRAEKIGPRSHHCGSVGGTPPTRRRPSGRWADSRWMTSAPSRASRLPTSGPAQYDVMSRIRSPLNGSGPPPPRRRSGGDGAVASPMACSPSRGAGLGGRSTADPRRYGGPGLVAPSRGLVTKVPRSTRWSTVGALAPLTMGALGMRKADAWSRTSWTVWRPTHSSMVGVSAVRSRKSFGSSVHSGWPTITAKSSHCWPVPHPSPTRPSLAAATPGVGTKRRRRMGPPIWSLNVTGW